MLRLHEDMHLDVGYLGASPQVYMFPSVGTGKPEGVMRCRPGSHTNCVVLYKVALQLSAL